MSIIIHAFSLRSLIHDNSLLEFEIRREKTKRKKEIGLPRTKHFDKIIQFFFSVPCENKKVCQYNFAILTFFFILTIIHGFCVVHFHRH